MIAAAHGHNSDQARVTDDVSFRVCKLHSAAQTVAIHRLQLLLYDFLHAHAAGVEGEAGILREDTLARRENCRDFRLHGGVRARHDLADSDRRPVWVHLTYDTLVNGKNQRHTRKEK